MKYVVVMLEGAADEPVAALDGQTPLQRARTPVMDNVARRGRVGAVALAPEGELATGDVCAMSLLGLDPSASHPGRAALEARAGGDDLNTDERLFKLQWVTIGAEDHDGESGVVISCDADGLTSAESRALGDDLLSAWRREAPKQSANLSLRMGPGHGALLVEKAGSSSDAAMSGPSACAVGKPYTNFLPRSDEGERFRRLINVGVEALARSEVNLARIENGLLPANMAWISSPGGRFELPSFFDRFGVQGAAITPDEAIAGMARAIGWERLPVANITGDASSDLAAKGQAAVGALDRFDLVCVHVQGAAHTSLRGDLKAKIESIEAADRFIAAPIVAKLQSLNEADAEPGHDGEPCWRIMFVATGAASVERRALLADPTPFAMSGAWVRSVVESTFDEDAACSGDLLVDPGHELMEYFLFSGVPNARALASPQRQEIARER